MQSVRMNILNDILVDLYRSSSINDRQATVFSKLQSLYDGPIKVIQWGQGLSIQDIASIDLELIENFSNRKCIDAPLYQHGENSFDVAIVNTHNFKANCIEKSKLLVIDEGIIIVTDVESWHPPDPFDEVNRDIKEIISSFNEYYYIDRHSSVIIVNRKSSCAHSSMPKIRERYKFIHKTFNALQENNILFLLLKNTDYIPINCNTENLIYLLIHPTSVDRAFKAFSQLGYDSYFDKTTHASHPYNAKPHIHFTIQPLSLHFDVAQGLYYSSLNNISKIPVHKSLQQSIWDRRQYVSDIWKCIPGINDLFIHIVCHSIYDKRSLPFHYSELLKRLYLYVDKRTLEEELKNIFLAFTPSLLKYIEDGFTEDIVKNYLQFSDY